MRSSSKENDLFRSNLDRVIGSYNRADVGDVVTVEHHRGWIDRVIYCKIYCKNPSRLIQYHHKDWKNNRSLWFHIDQQIDDEGSFVLQVGSPVNPVRRRHLDKLYRKWIISRRKN